MYFLFMLRRNSIQNNLKKIEKKKKKEKKNLDIEFKYVHNIIQIHNSILRDLQYFVEQSSYSIWMVEYSTKYYQLCKILY